jgi:long-chain fatty acid transport protein
MKARLVMAGACALLMPASAFAAGYAIYEQGAAVLGMGGAGTASVNDPSALFYNPAAMTRMDGNTLYGGGTLLTPNTSFAGMNPYPGYGVTEEMKKLYFFPPTFYYTHHQTDAKWALGAGLNSPFGLGVEWKNPDTFTGRYIVTQAHLTALHGMLSGAWAFNSKWSAAVGADAIFSKVDLQNRILVPGPGGGGAQVDVAQAELKSGFKPGYGWNVAVSGALTDQWKVGAYYRSKMIVDITDGDATFKQILTGNAVFDANVAASLPPNQGASTVLRFPALWSAGVAWTPNKEWTVETDFDIAEWSVFEDLPIRFHTTPANNKTLVEDYRDAWQIRAGAEHRMASYTYRFGYYYDQAAAPVQSVTPILPDAARNGFTLGFGKSFGNVTLDLYDLLLFLQQRSTHGVERDGYDGEYKTFINAAGIGLAWRF